MIDGFTNCQTPRFSVSHSRNISRSTFSMSYNAVPPPNFRQRRPWQNRGGFNNRVSFMNSFVAVVYASKVQRFRIQ